MKNSFILLAILTILIFTSCEYKCSGFPEWFDKYISYTSQDIISYTNELDTISFTVLESYSNGPSSSRGVYMDHDCLSEKYYFTDTIGDYFINETFNSFERDPISVSITSEEVFGFSEVEFLDHTYQNYLELEYYSEFDFNGQTYNETLLLVKDTINSSPKIGYIVKANPGGVLEFYDFETKEKWRLIN